MIKSIKALLILFGMMLMSCFAAMMGGEWLLQVPFVLAFGWVAFLANVVPQVTFRWGAIAETLVVAGILGVGSHLFLRWLWRQLHVEAERPPVWRTRWSVSLVALLVLLFAATMATVGIGHHVGWMMSGRSRLVRSNWKWPVDSERTSPVLCEAALERFLDGTPVEQITRTLMGDARTRAQAEVMHVVSHVAPGGDVTFVVFARDPLAREEEGGVRCHRGKARGERLDAKALAQWLAEPGAVAGAPP